MKLFCPLLLLICALFVNAEEQALPVYQNLEEICSRIPQLDKKPFAALIDKDSGRYQSEVTIFHDTETGAECWSLTREDCIHIANIERRCPWSWNGRYASFTGNRIFYDIPGNLYPVGKWSGHNYVVNADFSNDRKFFVKKDGKRALMHGKFMMWERSDKARLYFAVGKDLYRVTLTEDGSDPVPESIYTFPNERYKILQNISDNNIMCVQDKNGKNMQDMPNYYIIDLNKNPNEKDFCKTHVLSYGIEGVEGHDPQNEYRVHGIYVSRDGNYVHFGYGSASNYAEKVAFKVPVADLEAKPVAVTNEKVDKWGQYIGHGGYGYDGRIAYFSSSSKQIEEAGGKGTWGLWVRSKDTIPIYTGIKCGRGHASWNSIDNDSYVAHIDNFNETWADKKWIHSIVVGDSKGNVRKLCQTFDRLRGKLKQGYKAPDRMPYHAYVRPIQSPDGTKCWYHSSMLQSSDMYAGSFVAVVRRPHAPIEFNIQAEIHNLLKITWKLPAVCNEVHGINVYAKRVGEKKWELLNDKPLRQSSVRIGHVLKDGDYEFMACSEEWSRLESNVTSEIVCGSIRENKLTVNSERKQPITKWDSQAPATVQGFKAELENGLIKLRWDKNTDADLRYYNIYASKTDQLAIEQQRLLVSPPKGETAYIDWSAPKNTSMHYAIVAVDKQGNASQASYAKIER